VKGGENLTYLFQASPSPVYGNKRRNMRGGIAEGIRSRGDFSEKRGCWNWGRRTAKEQQDWVVEEKGNLISRGS